MNRGLRRSARANNSRAPLIPLFLKGWGDRLDSRSRRQKMLSGGIWDLQEVQATHSPRPLCHLPSPAGVSQRSKPGKGPVDMVHIGPMPKRETRVKKDAECSGATHRKVAGKRVCLILEIRVSISTYLFWQARFLIGYKIFLPYSLHHQFDDLSHFSQCLTSLAFLFVGEFVYKPVLFQSIQRIKMLFFRDISLYKESCSISSLFFFLSTTFSFYALAKSILYLETSCPVLPKAFSAKDSFGNPTKFPGSLLLLIPMPILPNEVIFITYKYFYN